MRQELILCLRAGAAWWEDQLRVAKGALFRCELAGAADPALLGFPVRYVVSAVELEPLGALGTIASTEKFFMQDGRTPLGAQIRFKPELERAKLHRAVLHELGHVLGLGHPSDDDRRLMDVNGTGLIVTKEELAHLRKGYASRLSGPLDT